jgi:hypothetical protein
MSVRPPPHQAKLRQQHRMVSKGHGMKRNSHGVNTYMSVSLVVLEQQHKTKPSTGMDRSWPVIGDIRCPFDTVEPRAQTVSPQAYVSF